MELDKLSLKFARECRRPKAVKTLKKKNKMGTLTQDLL